MTLAEDNELWAKTRKTRNDMLDYLDTFPNGLHASDANAFLYPPKPPPTPEPVVPIVEKPKPEPVRVVETHKPVVEKPKPEPVKVEKAQIEVADTLPQYFEEKEPSFFEKYKIHLIGSAVLLAFLIWVMMLKKPEITIKTNPLPTVEVTGEATAFSKAEKENTIPSWENFIKNYPKSGRLKDAQIALKTLQDDLKTLIGNINVEKTLKETMPMAKKHLKEAARIDPQNPEIIKLYKELK